MLSKKPIRAISIDYDACMMTTAAIAEASFLLVSTLLESNSFAPLTEDHPQKRLLTSYRNYLSRLIQENTWINKDDHRLIEANDAKIGIGLAETSVFINSLTSEDKAILKSTISSKEARALNLDVSDIVLKYQIRFIESLKKEASQYETTIVFIGSNRQSHYIDETLAFNLSYVYRGYALQVIPKIAEAIDAEFDPILLFNYFNKHIVDEHKVLILYAQIHALAAAHPKRQIHFEFYDDTAQQLIDFSDRGGFFGLQKAYPSLLPYNVKFHIRLFDMTTRNKAASDILSDLLSLEGKGMINSQLTETLLRFLDITCSELIPARSFIAEAMSVKFLATHFRDLIIFLEHLVADRFCEIISCENTLSLTLLFNGLKALLNGTDKSIIAGSMQFRFFKAALTLAAREDAFNEKSAHLKMLAMESTEAKQLSANMIINYSLLAPQARAGAGTIAKPEHPSSQDLITIINVLSSLISHIEGGSIIEPSSSHKISINGNNYRVPEGASKIFNTILNEASFSSKRKCIETVLKTKNISPTMSTRAPSTTVFYHTLQELIEIVGSKPIAFSIKPE